MSDLGWGGASRAGGVLLGGPPLATEPSYPVGAGLEAPLELARWRLLGNPVLALPHLVELLALEVAATVVTVVAWVSVLSSGRVPGGISSWLAGVARFRWRVASFVLGLRSQRPSYALPGGADDPGGDPAWVTVTLTRSSRLAAALRVVAVLPLIAVGSVLVAVLAAAWLLGAGWIVLRGRWPTGPRRVVAGVCFWALRVHAWWCLLADAYPPLSIR